MTISPFRRSWNVVVLTVCAGALALSIGCESTPDFRDMTAVQKAKAISTRRKQAEYEFSIFQSSEGDDTGIRALKRYAELHAETTRIAPNACERCFFNAGFALALVGTYYRGEVLLLDNRKQEVTPEEAAAIEAEIEDTVRIMRGYVIESNRYLETYIRQAGGIASSMAYWKLVDNYAALENWRQALNYLDQFEKVQRIAKTQNDVPAIRENFLIKLRLQEESEYEAELRKSGSQKPQMSN